MSSTSPSPYTSAVRPVPPPPVEGIAHVIPEDSLRTSEAWLSLQASEAAATPKRVSKRLRPDSIGALILAILLVFGLIAASFVASFAAIYEVAQYTGVADGYRWVFPVFIDMAIAAYTISLFIFRWRHAPIKWTITGLLLFASLSILANVAHVLAYWNGELPDYRAWIGVLLAASAPIGVLMASEEIARLAFVEDDDE